MMNLFKCWMGSVYYLNIIWISKLYSNAKQFSSPSEEVIIDQKYIYYDTKELKKKNAANWIGLISLLNSVSIFEGYLIPKSTYQKRLVVL